jgi:N-acetylmuramoyl-L-alanine amidase
VDDAATGRFVFCRVLCLGVLAFALLVCCRPAGPAEAATVPSPPRYEQAKKDLERLYQDARRSGWRDPWQKLADEFFAVYEMEKNWVNRPAALFRSALALDELARRSFARKDAEAALQRYQQLLDRHPSSALTDDALLRVALLRAERLDDAAGALSAVEKLCGLYPKSEACRQGRELIKKRQAGPPAPAAKQGKDLDAVSDPAPVAGTGPARIQELRWTSKGNLIQGVITLSKAPPWELRSQKGNEKSGLAPSLTLDLGDARPEASVSPGGKISDSALRRVRLDYHKSGLTRILLDFSKLARFSIREEDAGKRLIIQATAKPAALPGGLEPGNVVRSQSAAAAERQRAGQRAEESQAFLVATRNLASQFGLSVRTVVIDPGHGGKDSGTHHNGILEREVALDLALRLGKALKAQGFDVSYTRTRDTWISLSDRVDLANRKKGDLFVSLHVNASPNTKMVGLETYYLSVSSSTAAASLASFENMLSSRKLGDLETMITDLMRGARKDESVRLARDVQRNCLDALRKKGFTMENGGSRGAPFVVLMGTNMPAVLVEAGYCTNPQEAKRLLSPAFRNALAQGIVDGIVAYAERLRTVGR